MSTADASERAEGVSNALSLARYDATELTLMPLTAPQTAIERQTFNASDLIPVTMQNAFYQAIMEYLQDPGQLQAILKRLDLIQRASYPESFVKQPNFTCGT
jgi:hypothetical protein